MPRLLCARFENNDTNAAMLEQFESIEDAGIRWDVDDLGISRIEVTVNRSSSYAAYDSFRNHQGQRLALYTDWSHLVMSGWIMEAEWLTANQVRYVAKGPHIRMLEMYINRFYPPTTTVTETIEDTLTYYTRIWDGDTSNLYNNTTILDGWSPNQPQGEYPRDVIKAMLATSTPTFDITQFTWKDNPMKAGALGKFGATYSTRNKGNVTPDWIVYRRDLDKLQLSRSINEITTVGRIWYGAVTGTITKNNPSGTEDSGAQFLTDGVSPGDRITNTTVGGSASITEVISETSIEHDPWKAKTTGTTTSGSSTNSLTDDTVDFTTLGVANGDIVRNIAASTEWGYDVVGTVTGVATTVLTIGGGMTSGILNNGLERYEITGGLSVGDTYLIEATNPNRYIERQYEGEPPYWPVERVDYYPAANATQAGQLAEALMNVNPIQVQSFAIRSDFIRDGNGAKWPLWEVIAQGGGYIQIVDLYPTATTSLNQETTFFITALDYDHTSRQLRVTVNVLDRALDARLKREKILPSKRVARR